MCPSYTEDTQGKLLLTGSFPAFVFSEPAIPDAPLGMPAGIFTGWLYGLSALP